MTHIEALRSTADSFRGKKLNDTDTSILTYLVDEINEYANDSKLRPRMVMKAAYDKEVNYIEGFLKYHKSGAEYKQRKATIKAVEARALFWGELSRRADWRGR